MLPPALLNAADRLITTLMTLVDAVAPIAIAGSSIRNLPAHAAQTLALRLVSLITTLIRISTVGIRAPADPATPADIHPEPNAPRTQSGPAQGLPRRPGWLLAALPDIAPAIAADLRALLADPAIAALLGAAPTLHRTLRPLLRGLDLAASQPPPSPRTPPPRLPSAAPTPPPLCGDTPTPQAARRNPPSQPTRRTIYSLRCSNDYHAPAIKASAIP